MDEVIMDNNESMNFFEQQCDDCIQGVHNKVKSQTR